MCGSKWLHLTQTRCRVMLRSFYFRIMWLCDGCGKLFGRSRPIREHTKATQVHLGSCQMFSWKRIEKGKKRKVQTTLDDMLYVINWAKCTFLKFSPLPFQCNKHNTVESDSQDTFLQQLSFLFLVLLFFFGFYCYSSFTTTTADRASPSHANQLQL